VSESEEELPTSALFLESSQKGLKCPEFPWKEGKGLGPSDVRFRVSDAGEGTELTGGLEKLRRNAFCSHDLELNDDAR